MDISISNYVRNLPSVLLTCITAILHLSTVSAHQSVFTQIIVALGRPALRTPAKLLQCQQFFNYDWLGNFGPWWCVRTVVDLNNDAGSKEKVRRSGVPNGRISANASSQESKKTMTLTRALAFAIKELAPDTESATCPMPDLVQVPVDFSTYRPLASFFQRQRSDAHQEAILTQLQDPTIPVVLQLHGGAHCLMSPATHRPITTLLSYRSGSLICAPAFRQAPQSPFPAALLDAFITYLSLISPPHSSMHSSILPSRIILSGDSSGAGLASSLSLLLLTLSKHNTSITTPWSPKPVRVPTTPHAGLTLISPWVDITRSLPSTSLNTPYDILDSPPLDAASPPFPKDSIWPSSPPRAETYCTAHMTTHPLVSPLAATPKLWTGVGRVLVIVGWEGPSDEAEVLARRMHEAGGEVCFAGWEGMPHMFAAMPYGTSGWRANGLWARFCRAVVQKPESWRRELGVEEGVGRWTSNMTGEIKKVRLEKLGQGQVGCGYERKEALTDEVVRKKMDDGRRFREELERVMNDVADGPEIALQP